MKKFETFISYSHADKMFIKPIVTLLSKGRPHVVFQDYKDLEYGELWDQKIKTVISEVDVMFVFWCKHAAESRWVELEYTLGLELNKKVVPIFCDDTPRNAQLEAKHGIDVRDSYLHDPKGYAKKFAMNEFKKSIVRFIPMLGAIITIEEVLGPKEITNKIIEVIDKLFPPEEE